MVMHFGRSDGPLSALHVEHVEKASKNRAPTANDRSVPHSGRSRLHCQGCGNHFSGGEH